MPKPSSFLPLLAFLSEQAECQYLSDLHFLTDLQKTKLALVVQSLVAADVDLFEWNDAAAYITGEVGSFATAEDVAEPYRSVAQKYCTNGGNISASLTTERKGVRFTVENTVTGINPKQLEFFTQRFYRNDTSDKIKGFCIGLTLAQVVAQAHKGKLTVALPQKDRIQIPVTLK